MTNMKQDQNKVKEQELITEIKERVSKLTIYRIDTGREYIHLGHLNRILSELWERE